MIASEFHEKFIDDVAVQFSEQLKYISQLKDRFAEDMYRAAIRDCIIAFCNMVFKHDPKRNMHDLYARCGYEGTIPYYRTGG